MSAPLCEEGGSGDFLPEPTELDRLTPFELEAVVEEQAAEPEEPEGIEIDIPEDAYGAAILAVIRDIQHVLLHYDDRQICMVQAGFAMGVLGLNFFLQFSMIYFIKKYVVDPDTRIIQGLFKTFHGHFFDMDGVFLGHRWEEFEDKDAICQIAMTDLVFYCSVIFLWSLSILKEMRVSERLFRDITSLPRVEMAADMIHETEDMTRCVGLTDAARTTLIFMVVVPKVVIGTGLLLLGCTWLTATNSFENLIMNSLAMEFVTGIDEGLYETLLPVSHRTQVAECKFFIQRKATNKKLDYKGFQRSAMYMIACLIYVFSFLYLGQTVLPPHLHEIKEHCRSFVAREEKWLCTIPFWLGTTAVDTCFPFGEE